MKMKFIPIRKLRVKLVAFILIETLIIIIVINLYLSSSPKSQSETPDKITRDYVVNQGEQKQDDEPMMEAGITQKYRQVNVFKDDAKATDIKDHKCVNLRTLKGLAPICVYPREIDNMISAYITDFNTWEEDLLNATGDIISRDKDLVYLDLGCNIGVYTIFVAKLGTSVYAVDPNIDNLMLLSKSLRLENLQDNVTLILNAISDKHDNVTLEIVKGNIGGSLIKETNQLAAKSDNLDSRYNIETITLDDLSDILKRKKVFIKMDIESYEFNAIKGAHTFFQTVDVRYIQMEWTHFRYNDKGRVIASILIKHGLFPFSNLYGNQPLHPDRYFAWPENIAWIKR